MKRLVAVLALLIVLPVQAEVIRRGLTLGVADGRYVNVSGDTMTGPLLLTDGDANSPSVAFSSDADGSGTGMFRTAADSIGFSAAGSQRVMINAVGLTISSTSGILRWGSGAGDTGLARPTAGVVQITAGTSGGGALNLLPITAPAAPASGAVLYIDSADNDLKIKYSDGVVVVVGNKP